jgi:hypothetical protein
MAILSTMLTIRISIGIALFLSVLAIIGISQTLANIRRAN